MKGFYSAIEIDAFGKTLMLRERSFRNLEKHEVLIKVFCSPVNPADLMFIKGEYGNRKPEIFPIVPGLEGSGEIIAIGDNLDKSLIGKRAAVLGNPETGTTYDGLWAEYHYTTTDHIMLFEKNVPYENICSLINPLTAIGLLHTVKIHKQDSAIITGAAGTVGKMFTSLCEREGLNTISIVKNEEEENALKKIGAQNILSIDDSDCWMELRKICEQLKTKICFDCIGGDYTSKLLRCLTNDSTLYHFGNLEEKDIGHIFSNDMIFRHKHIKGFWLSKWLHSLSKEDFQYWWGYVRSELLTSELFHTKIAQEYDLEEIDFAINDYQMHMSKGKVVIAPYRIVAKKTG